MTFLIAMDSWKGSLSALEACGAVARGIRRVFPDAGCVSVPLADGGEGTLEIVRHSRPGREVRMEVAGPLPGRRVTDSYLWWPDQREALIEMARCAGLPLLTGSERDPLVTTTRGVGDWILDAVDRGVRSLTLAIGGSATVDGGAGMARALGWRFLDADGHDLPEGGGALHRLARLVPPETTPDLRVRVMCDVTNPLLGPTGAAAVFGPQKGARPEDLPRLEAGLARLADALHAVTGRPVSGLPGGGAAGGLGAGCVGFLHAELVGGIAEILRISGFAARLGGVDHVLTGEGRVDSQSLDGKVLSGVLDAAGSAGVPVSVIAGSCALSESDRRAAGIFSAESANHLGLPLEEAVARADELAADAGERFALALRTPD